MMRHFSARDLFITIICVIMDGRIEMAHLWEHLCPHIAFTLFYLQNRSTTFRLSSQMKCLFPRLAAVVIMEEG